MIQAVTLMNMNIPDDYIGFSKNFEVTSLTFDFVDFITLQDSLEDQTRRNLITGHKPLVNVGLPSGSLFVEYIYFFLLLILIGI